MLTLLMSLGGKVVQLIALPVDFFFRYTDILALKAYSSSNAVTHVPDKNAIVQDLIHLN